MQRRPAAEQPRRARVPARQARRGDRAPHGGVRDRARARHRRRRRDGRSRRSRRCTCAPATRSRPRSTRATRCSCSAAREDRLDEIGNARLVLGRALLEQDRLDEAERRSREAEDALAQLSSGSAPSGGLGRAGRPRADAAATTAARRRSTGPRPRRSRTSGSKRREEVKTVATRLALLIEQASRVVLTIVLPCSARTARRFIAGRCRLARARRPRTGVWPRSRTGSARRPCRRCPASAPPRVRRVAQLHGAGA